MAAIYLKINDNLFYKITTGSCWCINTEMKSMRQNKCLPSSFMEYVKVIGEIDFQNAKKQIGL